MEATVELNGQSYVVDGVLYKEDSRNGWMSIDNWTKISCDVLHVFYPRNYGIEETHFYRIKEGDKWLPRDEFLSTLTPDEIRARDVKNKIKYESSSRSKWEIEPGYGPSW